MHPGDWRLRHIKTTFAREPITAKEHLYRAYVEDEILGLYSGAIESVEKSLKIDPGNWEAYSRLWHIYEFGLKDPEKAKWANQQASKFMPK